ncbi:hypothetical protein CK203_105139 [Vitis vinifera]|uniref:Retrovirus-related Pol polyprotein from transposon TNT 1-94-like beta-barrel domain-containing protein n=1 Tax=Vitis vinifera TaxID=29760 RepID=A0A438EDH4_VITVI|nr:hypothetical protein CK203_105139 [Vitis vinifera]
MLFGQPYRRQKTLTIVRKPSPLSTFPGDFPVKSFSDTDHTIRCSRRRSSSFVKAPEGDSQSRADNSRFFFGGLNLTRPRMRALKIICLGLPLWSFGLWVKVMRITLLCRKADIPEIDKFFMVLTLIGLCPDLETVRDQILGSSSVPSLDDVFAHLLRISSTQTLPSDNTSDSSVLVSQTNSQGGCSGNRGRGQSPHCTYCNKLGHTRDRCYQLHGRPPRTAHVAQSSDPQPPQPPNSGASDHIFGNKDFFSSITTTSALPTVTLANGSQTVAKGIGLAHPLPSLPLTSVLYTPECSFNLISISKITRTLNCSITFSDKFVTLQDWSTGKTIGIGRESQGLYHLTSPSTPAVCISIDAPLFIHSRLGHPSLSKF